MPAWARFLTATLCLLTSLAIDAREPLRVGIAPDRPPMAYREKGQLSGIDIAAAEALGKLMDRETRFVEKPFAQLLSALQAGEVDIVMSGLVITPERSAEASFTQPYLSGGQMAMIRFEDAGRFAFKGALFRPGVRVAVEKGTEGERFAQGRLSAAQITPFDNLQQAFAALQGKQVDFLIHHSPTALSLANDDSKQDLMSLNNLLTDEKFGWAVAKENTTLLNAVNEQLAHMQQTGMLRAIINRWIPVTVQTSE